MSHRETDNSLKRNSCCLALAEKKLPIHILLCKTKSCCITTTLNQLCCFVHLVIALCMVPHLITILTEYSLWFDWICSAKLMCAHFRLATCRSDHYFIYNKSSMEHIPCALCKCAEIDVNAYTSTRLIEHTCSLSLTIVANPLTGMF